MKGHMRIKTGIKKALILMLSVVLVSLVAIAVVAAHRFYIRLPQSRLFYAWKKVDEVYYDRTFAGFDWPAVLETYKKHLPRFDWDGRETSPFIQNMLSLLEVSHLRHIPGFMASEKIKEEAVLADYFPELRDISGMVLVMDMLPRISRVLSLETWSPLYAHGVRVGDRILLDTLDTNISDKNKPVRLYCYHINTAGVKKEFEFDLPAPPLGTQQTAVPAGDHVLHIAHFDQAEIQALKHVSEDRNSPITQLHYISLGAVTTALHLPKTKVIDVVKDSEADKAGVEIGSFIGDGTDPKTESKNIGGKTVVKSNGIYKVILPDGKKVTFSVNKEITLSDFERIRSAQLIGQTLVIAFNEMTDENTQWVLQQIKNTPATAIVLDLRYNTGGSAIAEERLLAGFLASGTRIGTEIEGKKTNEINVPAGYTPTDKPMAVLIGLVSASGAEVIARTLQFHHRARIYGAQSSGQLLASRFYKLTDGSYIQIPSINLLDPAGKPIEWYGVMPDVKKWKTLSDVRAGRDPVLECALADLSGGQCH
ncbi:peptidase S41 [Xylella fastidiosa subsp. multiplex]|uniref:S41 family peptidase n=1 Tax=Xylella fastidiosa TaxID=2371 RepID=UPI000165D838|nr:S41 family peptidase [Xylella fastidiosa]ACA12066.1 carboxyl-terminal protease [Xylella fastidiosa M12]ERI59354.1 Peptidase S41 [Xylella fastidiosa subsp. multiplex Griffin-1]QPC01084.1 peptidase S41 [Xylella fastidiosa subsp. multiplex]UIT46548.1 S41 family peptidase [Xylella fastidiosa subsp. multiplex]